MGENQFNRKKIEKELELTKLGKRRKQRKMEEKK